MCGDRDCRSAVRGGETVLGGQEVDEEVAPSFQRGSRGRVGRRQGGPGIGTGVDLVAVHGDD